MRCSTRSARSSTGSTSPTSSSSSPTTGLRTATRRRRSSGDSRASRENVVVLDEEKRGGMGWDMRAGFAAASGDFLVVIDGDAQNPVEDVWRMLELLRRTGGGRRQGRPHEPRRRSLPARGLRRLQRPLPAPLRHWDLWDVNGKPKGLTRAALRAAFARVRRLVRRRRDRARRATKRDDHRAAARRLPREPRTLVVRPLHLDLGVRRAHGSLPAARARLSRKGTVLVTGGSGAIGSRLLRELGERGWRRRSLVHRSPVVDADEHTRGELADVAALTRAADGASAVVHSRP